MPSNSKLAIFNSGQSWGGDLRNVSSPQKEYHTLTCARYRYLSLLVDKAVVARLPPTLRRRAAALFDLEDLNGEVQCAPRRDAPSWEPALPVALAGRDEQLARLALLHPEAPLVPALDDLPHPGLVREG